MTERHAPSRRELLLASGTLFAWAYLPKLARAEGRDPRFLTIVLRGALDGLATVAPVGDQDWVSLRGDNALTLDSKTSASIASARISMARTCSRAGLKSQARPTPGGSTVYWWALRPRTASVRTGAGPSPSDR